MLPKYDNSFSKCTSVNIHVLNNFALYVELEKKGKV